jgi:hypothetical protein
VKICAFKNDPMTVSSHKWQFVAQENFLILTCHKAFGQPLSLILQGMCIDSNLLQKGTKQTSFELLKAVEKMWKQIAANSKAEPAVLTVTDF